MELENFVFEKVNEEFEARKLANERVSFHSHAPGALFELVEGIATEHHRILIIVFTHTCQKFFMNCFHLK